ncbi:MAG TPA: amidohydrolase [Bacillota bacterium]|nr:amidohydrolase [Bacillota bacterium]
MKRDILSWVEEHTSELISVSDEIWGYAELGLDEHRSAKVQMDYLESHGFEIRSGIGGMETAFVASWGEGKPVIGFLGEYDALPMVSNKPVPYKEPLIEGGTGHGCGHNLLGVSSMGAAVSLKHLMEQKGLPGTVRYYGCPAEESSFGKTWMVRDGVFDDVDVALTWHPGAVNSVKNESSLADFVLKFNFYGKTAHASGGPWNGRSALDGVELMNSGVERMREHMRPECRVHYVISYGGGAPNVVPDYAQNFFDVRAKDIAELKKMRQWVQDIAKGAALMTQTHFEELFLGCAANVIPNRVIAQTFHSVMEEIGAPKWSEEELEFAQTMQQQFEPELVEQAVESLEESGATLGQEHLFDTQVPYSDEIGEGKGSTDVGDVSWVVPTAQFSTACHPLGIPGHSWAITSCSGMSIGHKGMLYAAKILGVAGYRFLTDPDLRQKAREEWQTQLKGRQYECLIPPEIKAPPKPF